MPAAENMPRTKTAVPSTSSEKARSPSPDPADRPLGPLAVTIPASDREEVKVNNANLTELKNACDDAVKRVRPFVFGVCRLDGRPLGFDD